MASGTALIVALLALVRGSESGIGDYGLISALPLIYLAALVLVVANYLGLLSGCEAHDWSLGLHLVALIVLLDGAPSLLETTARGSVAWLHVGFVDQIARHGAVIPTYDARFSWPGFFAAVAVVGEAARLQDAVPLLRWAPAVLHLLYLGPLLLIGRALVGDRRVRWLGLLFIYLGDWVGQVYFSPQGIAYLLFITVIALLVSIFGSGYEAALPARGPLQLLLQFRSLIEHRAAREAAPIELPRGVQLALYGCLLLITLALVPSHQLTPIALFLTAIALVLVRRTRLRAYPWVLALLTAAWVSYAATDFWAGHLQDLVGSGGGQAVQANVMQRLSGSSAHRLVVDLRLLVTGLMWSVALLGALRLARRRQLPLTLAVLAGASLPIPLLQSYGGEALLRAYFYSLPFMSFLAAHALVTGVRQRTGFALAAAMTAALLVLFPIVRYGNESFERVRPDEISALRYLYRIAPPGATFVALIDNVPWRFQDLSTYAYVALPDSVNARSGPAIDATLRGNRGPVYLVLTAGQEAWGEQFFGYPKGWVTNIAEQFRANPRYRQVWRSSDAQIFQQLEAVP